MYMIVSFIHHYDGLYFVYNFIMIHVQNEREFERERKRVEQIEESSKKLYKDTKRWMEANNGKIFQK